MAEVSETTIILGGLVVIIAISFLLVICILPLVDRFGSTYVGPTWVPEFIVREGYDASKFLPSLTKEERILVLEKLFQVRSYPKMKDVKDGDESDSVQEKDVEVAPTSMKNSSQQSSLVDGEDNVQELEGMKTDLDKEATEPLAENEQGLDSLSTSKGTVPGNHSDNSLKEGTNTAADPSKSSNLNFLDMIVSQFQSEEEKTQESLEEDVCPICMETYGEDCNVTNGTQCDHLFHKHCIIKWMEKKDFCPFCRNDMMTVGEFENAAELVLDEKRFREAKDESGSRDQGSAIAREDSLL